MDIPLKAKIFALHIAHFANFVLKICINLGKNSLICCKRLKIQTFLGKCLHVCKYVCTFASQLRTKRNNKHNENNKQQTAAVIAAKWRRKTLNRLNVKLHTCKGGLNSTEHYNRTCKANKRNATTKNGKFAAALNKCCKSGFNIPYSHCKQQRNETKGKP